MPQLLTDKFSYEPIFCEIDPPSLRDIFKTVLASTNSAHKDHFLPVHCHIIFYYSFMCSKMM